MNQSIFRPFWRLLSYVKPYWKRLALAILFIGLAEGLRLYLVWLTRDVLKPIIYADVQTHPSDWFIAAILAGATLLFPTISPRLALLIAVCLGAVVAAFGRAVFTFGHNFLANQVGQRTIINVRRDVFSHLQTQSLSFFENQTTGKLLSRVTNDIALLQGLITVGLQEVIGVPLVMVGAFAMMLYLSWKLTLIAVLVIPVLAWVIYTAGQMVRRIRGSVQAKLAELTSVLQDALSGIRVVQIFGMEEHEVRRFERENTSAYRLSMREVRVLSALMPLVEFLGILAVVVGIWFGGLEVLKGSLKAEELVTFMVCFHTFAMGFRKVSHINTVKEQVTAAAERIFQVLDTQPEVRDRPGAIELTSPKGHIVFNHVTFAYPSGREVLRDVNLEIRPHEVVALVGPSGAGKTTIVNLILRLYEPVAGLVMFDGVDVRDLKLKSLRQAMGVVPQETVLFEGTVRENIAYGKPDATEEEIEEAAKQAYAHEFIIRLPEGYDTWVGERGVKLSAGQRQRIAIARAILRNPALLVLDEATSNLDAESESMVQKALLNVTRARTTIIIAHRLSTLRIADRILVIDDGGIVEEGSHEELLMTDGLYRRLHGLQSA